MTIKSYNKKEPLTEVIGFRVSKKYFDHLEGLRMKSNCRTIGEFARSIVQQEKIIWYHKDASMESTASQLAGIRNELKSIGVNINQVTRYFNSKQLPSEKIFEALKLLDEYKKVSSKVDMLLLTISELATKWSQK